MKTVKKDIIAATHPEPLLLALSQEIKRLEKAYMHMKYKRFLEGRIELYAVFITSQRWLVMRHLRPDCKLPRT